jgi:hypothetical protein
VALGYSEQEIQALKSERVVLRSDRMLNTEAVSVVPDGDA